MKRVLVSGVLAASLIAGGAVAVASSNAKDSEAGQKSDRSLSTTHAPQDTVYEDGVLRVWGANRYGTAAQISQTYGWDNTNTITAYIASGQNYPDALAIGLSHFADGPLLLVSVNGIPTPTRDELTRIQPCYIHIMGGTGVVNDTVFDDLKAYADPTLCEE